MHHFATVGQALLELTRHGALPPARVHDALAAFEAAHALAPDDVRAAVWPVEARAAYERVLERHPERHDAHHNLALMALADEPERALAHYREAERSVVSLRTDLPRRSRSGT